MLFHGFAHAQDYRAFDYRKADSIAAHTVMGKGEKYVDIAHRLTAGLPTEQEKFRSILRWVCDHLEYTEGVYTKDPGQLLKSGKAVCQGYAALLFEMCKEIGLECEIITGYARNEPDDIGKRLKGLEHHAWNAIKLGGNWYLTDATWASGYYDKKTKTYTRHFNEVYFLSGPDFFSYSHFPREKKWQLLDKKVSRHKFLHRPIVWKNYDSLGLRAVAGRAHRFTFVRIPLRLSYRKSQIPLSDSVTFALEPDCPYYKPKIKPGDANTKTRVRLPMYKRGLHFVTLFINHKAVATYKVRTWGIDPDKIEARRAARKKKREKK
ncbi:MAG: kyphoscoliosis peptidase-like [Bacteroidetes bacterium]|nr:MAG: kyphoscoliosis peptidase-like [Bacteroidota bacterium]